MGRSGEGVTLSIPQAACDDCRKMAQRTIPGVVPELVIDALEIVHIQHHQRKWLVVAQGMTAFALEYFGQLHAVGQTGEAVSAGQLDQSSFVLHPAAFVDMREQHDGHAADGHVCQHHRAEQ